MSGNTWQHQAAPRWRGGASDPISCYWLTSVLPAPRAQARSRTLLAYGRAGAIARCGTIARCGGAAAAVRQLVAASLQAVHDDQAAPVPPQNAYLRWLCYAASPRALAHNLGCAVTAYPIAFGSPLLRQRVVWNAALKAWFIALGVRGGHGRDGRAEHRLWRPEDRNFDSYRQGAACTTCKVPGKAGETVPRTSCRAG